MRRERATGLINSVVSNWGRSPKLILAMQAVDVTIAAGATTGTASITSVDMANSVLIFGGFSTGVYDGAMSNGTYRPAAYHTALTMTNATTVTASRYLTDASGTCIASGMVVSFVPGFVKSIQRGSLFGGYATSATVTITSVDISKAYVAYCGTITEYSFNTSPGNNLFYPLFSGRLDLQNATTVRVRAEIANYAYISYEVVEWN